MILKRNLKRNLMKNSNSRKTLEPRMMQGKRGIKELGTVLAALLISLALAIVAGCARPLVMENCDYQSAFLTSEHKAEDFRLYVLTAPPLWSLGEPSIDITLDNPGNKPTHYHLALERLDDNERMHTYYGGKNVDLWRRYRLANRSEERYRQLLADVAGESNTVRRLEVSTSISRSSDKSIREIRIGSADSSFEDVVCRL